MMLGNYRTIMIGLYLAKLYGSILELNECMGIVKLLLFRWIGRLSKGFHNFGSHIDPQAFIEEGSANFKA
mgnify:CR=1 FL=1